VKGQSQEGKAGDDLNVSVGAVKATNPLRTKRYNVFHQNCHPIIQIYIYMYMCLCTQ